MLSEEIEYLVYLCREDGDATSPMSMNAKAHSLRPSSLLSRSSVRKLGGEICEVQTNQPTDDGRSARRLRDAVSS